MAELLGVTKQRAHRIADEPGFPLRSPRTRAGGCEQLIIEAADHSDKGSRA